ncbi:unnamed protein product [Adineta steineri]|uniref:EF-hand domain-containing protein n=1 Tax=Adineta steineri TaxID=433720 RepID=A0A815S0K2_9BILA|nr:unnamed protein product [Adineta steineri]CAF3959033.1 unnamed protein product [Adineta steineri]
MKFYVRDPTKAEAFWSYVVNLFDDKDKATINFEEFLRIIDFSHQGELDSRLGLAFDMYNTSDDDDKIDEQELINLLKAMYDLVGGVYCEDNEDRKKSVSRDPKEFAKDIIKDYDIDKDKKLDKNEFIKACKDNKRLMKLLAPYENENQSSNAQPSSSQGKQGTGVTNSVKPATTN